MTVNRLPVSRSDVRKRLPEMYDYISRTDSERLEKILPLFRLENQTTANLASCLDAVSPGKDRQKQLADFRQFRQHVRKAFDKAGIGIELMVDSRKRTDAEERTCWFTGPETDRTAEHIEQFSEGAASSGDDIEPVEPRGIDSEHIGVPRVHCCVLVADKDRKLADSLVDLLREQFAAQKEFVYDVWDRRSIHAGEVPAEEQQSALKRADIVLALASPSFQADDSLTRAISPYKLDAPASASTDKHSLARASSLYGHAIPVLLRTISEKHDIECFGGREIFQIDLPQAGKRSFDKCNASQRDEFVQKLFGQIHRLELPLNRQAKTGKRELDEQARELIDLFDDGDLECDPLDPRGAEARFGEDVTKRNMNDEANAVMMFAELESWVRDPNAAVYAAVLGESGIGKTTLLKTLTLKLIDQRRDDSSLPLPIYVDLRLFSPTIQEQKRVPTNLVELLDEILGRATHRIAPSGFRGEDIVRMVQQDRAILIFDGLDEKLVHLDESQGMALMRVLWEALPYSVVRKQRHEDKRPQHGRLVFSCRSHYFKTLREQNALFLGEDREGLRGNDYRAWVLLPFNEDQVREYLRRTIGEERVEPAIDLFQSVHNLEELSGRPLLLSLMTPQIDALEQRRARGEAVYGVTLYEMLVDRWLTRDGGKHHLRPEDKVSLMQNIAAAMWADGRREWEWTEVRDWLAEQLVRTDVLRARYDHISFEVLEEDFRTATFVLRPGQSKNNFRFAHTSLQEYFLACHLKTSLISSDLDGWSIPLPSPETLEFLGQLIASDEPDSRNRKRCLQGLCDILGSKPLSGTALAAGTIASDTPAASAIPLTDTPASAVPLTAKLAAFHYWLLAVEKDLPEPEPAHVDLSDCDLYGINVRGRSPDQRLNLVGANLSGCNLRGQVQWQHVDLTNADLTLVQAEFAEFYDVRAPYVTADRSVLTGSVWRFCNLIDVRWDGAALDGMTKAPSSGANIGTEQPPPLSSGGLELTLSQGHANAIWSCTFSPDGKQLLSASDDKTLKLWNAKNGKCLITCEGHDDTILSCAFSPDGKQLLSASDDGTLKLWDAKNGKCLLTCKGHDSWVRSCAFSPDGEQLLSASRDRTLRVWDAKNGDSLISCKGHGDTIKACAFSPDGQRLLSASSDSTLKLWDAKSGKCVLTCAGHKNTVQSCAFSPDGQQLLSASADGTLKLWDAKSGKCILTCKGHGDWSQACAFSPDGQRLLSASYDRTLKLWDAKNGECLITCKGHDSTVLSCAFSPDGKQLLSASNDNTLKLWDAKNGRLLCTILAGRDKRSFLKHFDNCIQWASEDAWRYIAWREQDPKTKGIRLLPAEHFGPLPGTEAYEWFADNG